MGDSKMCFQEQQMISQLVKTLICGPGNGLYMKNKKTIPILRDGLYYNWFLLLIVTEVERVCVIAIGARIKTFKSYSPNKAIQQPA